MLEVAQLGVVHFLEESKLKDFAKSAEIIKSISGLKQRKKALLPIHLFSTLVVLLFPSFAFSDSLSPSDPYHIEYEEFRLENGLRVLVHEDRSNPIVAVNLTYLVGSRDEWKGYTGFAHLFEHLMFNGSENFSGEFIAVLQNYGSTQLNGTTNRDRTNYYQTVPTQALDLALWLESDRMGNLLGGVDEQGLETQRNVVFNEKRQRENSPVGPLWGHVLRQLYPSNHPYVWPTIGYEEDLAASDLESVRKWFRAWYRPANAVLILAGDIDVETARQKAEHFFGSIPSYKPPRRVKAAPFRLKEAKNLEMTAQVAFPNVFLVWPIDSLKAGIELQLFCDLYFASGVGIIWRELIFEKSLAHNLRCSVQSGALGGELIISLESRDLPTLQKAEATLRESMAVAFEEGPTQEDLDRVRGALLGLISRYFERVTSKAQTLASGIVESGRPDFYKRELQTLRKASPKRIKRTVAAWLTHPALRVQVTSGGVMTPVQMAPDYVPAATEPSRGAIAQGSDYPDPVAREQLPDVAAPDAVRIPKVLRHKLPNGAELLYVQVKDAPIVSMRIQTGVGSANDPQGIYGLSTFSAFMMQTSETPRGHLKNLFQQLGMNWTAWSGLHQSGFQAIGPSEHWQKGLELLSHAVSAPRLWDNGSLMTGRARWLARIARSKKAPRGLFMRVWPQLVFDTATHPYAHAFIYDGQESAIQELGTDQIDDWQQSNLQAAGMQLLVAGDLPWDDLRAQTDAIFSQFETITKRPLPLPPTVKTAAKPGVHLLHQPGAPQALIVLARPLPSDLIRSPGSEVQLDLQDHILGGGFDSRLNTRLREEKAWSYGIRSRLLKGTNQLVWIISSQVDQTNAVAALQEAGDILRESVGSQSPLRAEIDKYRTLTSYVLARGNETAEESMSWLADLLLIQKPLDYDQHYATALQQVTPDHLSQFLNQNIPADGWVQLLIGDQDKLIPQLEEAGMSWKLIEEVP